MWRIVRGIQLDSREAFGGRTILLEGQAQGCGLVSLGFTLSVGPVGSTVADELEPDHAVRVGE